MASMWNLELRGSRPQVRDGTLGALADALSLPRTGPKQPRPQASLQPSPALSELRPEA